jgi:hypothetical protein
MEDKLHQHFQANVDTWLDNPHIRSAHTSLNKNNDREVFLFADDLNDESVLAIKKSIEQEGHVVNLAYQQHNLKHETVCKPTHSPRNTQSHAST